MYREEDLKFFFVIKKIISKEHNNSISYAKLINVMDNEKYYSINEIKSEINYLIVNGLLINYQNYIYVNKLHFEEIMCKSFDFYNY